MSWLLDHWQLLIPLVLGALAVWWLMPADPGRPRIVAALLGIAALAVFAGALAPAAAPGVENILAGLFGCSSIAGGVLMITSRNPVYGALWFALVTLSVCGLFLLQSAPFLAAATVIVYAGAIIVTFLFVIMLASQSGSATYDQQPRQPFIAAVTAFVLLGGMFYALGRPAVAKEMRRPSSVPGAAVASAVEDAPVNEDARIDSSSSRADQNVGPGGLAAPARQEIGTMRGLGRLLFSEYLYAVELAGTLLLIATIGAIAMAPRRSHGGL